MNPETPAIFDAGLGGEIGELLERAKKLGPAVGIPRVIDTVHTDEDIKCPQSLGPRECERRGTRCSARGRT